MSQDTGYFAPIVLADAREKRARRARPGHWADQPSVPVATHLAFAEADEHTEIARSGGWAFVLVVLTIAPLLVALGIHFLLR